MSDLETALDELYTVPPEEFVAARNALVKRLRGEKRRDEAGEVAALRRPARPAWALNQLALSGDERLDGLLAAVEAVHDPPDGDLRAAIEGLREAVTAAGAEASSRSGLAAGDLAAALHATVSDAEAFSALTRGRLTEIPSAGAAGLGLTLPAPPPRRAKATATAVPGKKAAAPPPEEPKVDQVARRRAQKALTQATKAWEQAQAGREKAEAELDAARAALDEARARVETAEAGLREAEAAEAAAEATRDEVSASDDLP